MSGLLQRFRFHGELNDFLPSDKRGAEFEQIAGSTDTIKHAIESLGVPHTEIGSVTVNGAPAGLTDRLVDYGLTEVFPPATPVFVPHLRFVVDGHLGRLAAYLRMLGFDTWYERLADDAELAAIASTEHRVLLTRDVGLLKRREVQYGYCVRSDKPQTQLREVSRRFAPTAKLAPFCRCMDCNAPLLRVSKEEVADVLPPHTRETKDQFSRCSACRKIFWRGTHYERMMGWIDSLNDAANG